MLRKAVVASVLLNLFCFVSHFSVYAQELPKVIPPSPDAASLGKFGDVPVSYYTGIPSVSIPLYEVKAGAFTLPITLSYHSSGVKVEEEASWVGLGWALQAGGVITRSTKGLNDLGLAGYPFSPVPNSSDQNYMEMVADGNADAEPDIFYFNFGGRSGKFVLSDYTSENSLEVTLISQEKLRIKYTTSGKWIITAEDGVQYIFNVPEYIQPYSSSSDVSAENAKTDLISGPSFVSSWYLSQIILPTGEDIYFDYSNGWDSGFSSWSRTSVNQMIRILYDNSGGATCQPPNLPQVTYLGSRNTFFNVYLKKIRFRNFFIDFITESRSDIAPATGSTQLPQRLKEVNIYSTENSVNSLIKKYELRYGYFNEQYANLDARAYLRLKLLSVTEKSGSEFKNPYEFKYYKSPGYQYELPSKDSYSRDFWGFFNGKDNETIHSSYYSNRYIGGSLIPPFSMDFGYGLIQDSGADRSPDQELTKVGVLSEVIYPTGGTTSFEHQAHGYSQYEYITTPKIHTLWRFGPLVPNPPNYGPNQKPIEFTVGTQIKIDITLYCHFWQEDGTSCQTSVGSVGGIRRVNGDGTTEPLMSFTMDSPANYQVVDHKHYDVSLAAGKYEFYADLNYDGWVTSIDIKYDSAGTQQAWVNKPVGGVRISKITTSDPSEYGKDQVTKFAYEGGQLMSPKNIFHYYEKSIQFCSSQQSATAFYLTRRSWSNFPLGTGAQGNHIGYSTVTVQHGAKSENGKTVYQYINYPEEILADPPIPDETTVVPNNNGLLLSQTDYKMKPDSSFQKVKMIEKTYDDITELVRYVPGIKTYASSNTDNGYISTFKPYVLTSERWNLKNETTTTYDNTDENKYTSLVTEYLYENPAHLQVTSTIQTVNNRKLITSFKYPADFADADADAITIAMKGDKHMHSIVLQKTLMQEKQDTVKILNSLITRYDADYLPSEVASLQISKPILNNATQFPVYKPALGYDLTKFKKELVYDFYDSLGNLLQFHQANNIKVSYIWDLNYPVAEVMNAAVDQVFFTGFESNSGTSGDARTGLKYHNSGSFSIPFSPPAGVAYKMSYWYWQNNKWNFSNELPFNQAITAGTRLDEIRVYPSGAQMTTYSYSPGIGITSVTDANNQTIYYEYDPLGRLKYVKDIDKNFIKEFKYHYTGQ